MSLTNLREKVGTRTGTVPPQFQDTLILRVKKSKFEGSNSKGNPMTTLTMEVVDPITLNHWDGVSYDLSSIEVPMWLVYTNTRSDGQQKSGMQQILDMHEKLELPVEIDLENPDRKIYENLTFRAIVKSKERTKQKITGLGSDGKPIKSNVLKEDGTPMTDGWQMSLNADDIIGLAEAPENRPY